LRGKGTSTIDSQQEDSINRLSCRGHSHESTAAFGQEGNDRNDPTGVWLLNIAFDGSGNTTAPPTASGPNTLASFNSVVTVNADGTYAYSSVLQYTPIALTPGRGLWERAGGRKFLVSCYGMVLGSLSAPQYLGYYNDHTQVTLNKKGDQLTMTSVLDVYDPAGNLTQTITASGSGRRANQ
jgi:hypothetical protein